MVTHVLLARDSEQREAMREAKVSEAILAEGKATERAAQHLIVRIRRINQLYLDREKNRVDMERENG